MKVKIINDDTDGNLIVTCVNYESGETQWDHTIAPGGSLECHVMKNTGITFYQELDYRNNE